jgi:hypothetical protein
MRTEITVLKVEPEVSEEDYVFLGPGGPFDFVGIEYGRAHAARVKRSFKRANCFCFFLRRCAADFCFPDPCFLGLPGFFSASSGQSISRRSIRDPANKP